MRTCCLAKPKETRRDAQSRVADPVRGEVCQWCEQAAAVREFVAAIGLGALPVRSAVEATTEAA